MKKITVLIISLLIAVPLLGKTMYISSLKVKLYSSPVKSSKVLSTLKRGDSVQIQKSEGKWLYVSASGNKGWVPEMFLKETKPSGSISILGNKQKSNRIHARERASSEVSAASARGLVSENSNTASRSRLSKDSTTFNPQDLEEIEKVTVSEDELLKFLSRGGVQ